MTLIVSGRAVSLLLTCTFAILTYYYYHRGKMGKVAHIRKISALDAVEESVKRASEMGRPVHFTTGVTTKLSSSESTQVIAGLSVLDYIAKITAKLDIPLIVSVGHPSQLPITHGTVKGAYTSVDKEEEFKEDFIRSLSPEQQAYVSAVQGIFMREKPATNIMIGPFYAELLQLAETGSRIGAIQIGGTAKTPQLPFMVTICDHVLIGEEIFAAGAYLSEDPGLASSIAAADIIKMISIIFIILGVITINFGSEVILSLLKL